MSSSIFFLYLFYSFCFALMLICTTRMMNCFLYLILSFKAIERNSVRSKALQIINYEINIEIDDAFKSPTKSRASLFFFTRVFVSLSLSVCTCEGFFSSCRFLWMACMINTLNCSLFGNFRNFVYFVWKISKFFWKYWLYFNPYFAFDSFFFSNTSRNIQSPKFQPVCNCQWIRLQTQYKRRLSCRNVYLWFGLK